MLPPTTHLDPFPFFCDEGEVVDSGIRCSCLLQTQLNITGRLYGSSVVVRLSVSERREWGERDSTVRVKGGRGK